MPYPRRRRLAWVAAVRHHGSPAEPAYYDYGSTVVYSGDTVIDNGEQGCSADL